MKALPMKMLVLPLVALFYLTTLGLFALAEEPQLQLEVFVSEPREINTTSAIIWGPTEMMVVSAQATISSAESLARVLAEKRRPLKYIFLTHPHLDHYQGAGILKRHFPEAKFVATAEVAAAQIAGMGVADQLAPLRYGSNAAVPSIPAVAYEGDGLEIDGETVEIWKDVIGDGGLTTPHSALYIPSLNALIPSDTIYFNAHVMMGGSTADSRKKSVEQIDRWIVQGFDIIVPGHTPKVTLPELTPSRALKHTRDYILAYDEAIGTSTSSDETIRKMLDKYPSLPHEAALYLGTYLNFNDMEKLTTEYLPRWKAENGY